jgi:putative endonuclease
MYTVYILQCSDDTFYVGQTSDLERRLRQHKGISPGGAEYTLKRQPVDLVWYMTGIETRRTAQEIEAELQWGWTPEQLWELTQGKVWARRLVTSMVHSRQSYPEALVVSDRAVIYMGGGVYLVEAEYA